jgi:sensor histidine kinase YesM
MANVRRRLVLCYGIASNLEISTVDEVTTVRFLLPARKRL